MKRQFVLNEKPTVSKARRLFLECQKKQDFDKIGVLDLISHKAKNSLLYKEFSDQEREHFFSFSQKKFLHNIDSLYYVVRLENDWTTCEHCQRFREVLDGYRRFVANSNEPVVAFDGMIDTDSQWIMNGIGSTPYMYDLEQKDKFIAFFIHSKINPDTPEIWVQIRSQYLWLEGEHESLLGSLFELEELLGSYNIKIREVRENRIDFAYHTNYIQNPTNYFSDHNIKHMQQSQFKRGSKEFSFKGQWDMEIDYVTLGRKKSNNLFFRIYDKTKEVIQQQYKQFFIEIWHNNKMISTFDKYCIEKAFLHVSPENHKFLEVARLQFYIEHGSDESLKKEAHLLIHAKNKNYDSIEKLADQLVPPVTKILNVEIETKRKYYYSLEESSRSALSIITPCPSYAKPIMRILDNKQVFHNHLTCKNEKNQGIIRFIDFKKKNRQGNEWTKKTDFPTSDFWKRLQMTKVNKRYFESDKHLLRQYQDNLSIEVMKKRLVNMVSTYSLYVHGEDVQNDTYHDALDFMATLNETDLEKAIEYKRTKKSQLKNRLLKVEGVKKLDKHFKLVDTETGLLIKSYH